MGSHEQKRRMSQESKDGGSTSGGGKRKNRKTGGKACVYCRRSHMVCEGGRPCDRCIKRDISHLCRDASPQPSRYKHTEEPEDLSIPISIPSTTTTTNTNPMMEDIKPNINDIRPSTSTSSSSQLPPQLYADPNFPPSWPLLPDTSTNTGATFVDGTIGNGLGIKGNGSGDGNGMGWGMSDESELGALSKYLGELGVPSLPGSFLDVLTYFSRDQNDSGIGNTIQMSDFVNQTPTQPQSNAKSSSQDTDALFKSTSAGPSGSHSTPVTSNGDKKGLTQTDKGKGKETPPVNPLNVSGMSRIEKYFLAAADQPSGPRHSRLAQVIKAKYDAGLLKPYDYIKGYERMNKWMDSGRAAPRQESVSGSAPSSPIKGGRKSRMVSQTPNPSGSSISPESRRRILAALNGFRPKFRQIARTLTDVDLVFVEEAMERWMLEYDRAFASIHTPSCVWRRTGEIQKANQEFANLLQIPASMFRNGQLCVYELMDEDSAVKYWEGYGKIAFDAGQRSIYTTTTLKIPQSLTRQSISSSQTHPSHPPTSQSRPPDSTGNVALPASDMSDAGSGVIVQERESYREIKCCFSVTIRRDAWGVPVAIMGQWIPI